MKLFASSRLFDPIGLTDGIHLAHRLGYDGAELWHEQLAGQPLHAFRRNLPPGFELSLHAASSDINLTSANRRIAAASLAEVLRSVEWATTLGASCLVVHPGRASSTKDDPRAYAARQEEAFVRILDRTRPYDVHVAVENMENRSKELVVSPADLTALLDRIVHPDLFVCLDSAHAFTAGGVDAFLSAPWAERIAHCHVSHSTPTETHVPLDQGISTMTPRFAAFLATFEGAVAVEGAPRRPGDVADLLSRNRAAIHAFLNQGGR